MPSRPFGGQGGDEMFYLGGRCSRNGKNEEDEFGWWLNDLEGIQSTSSPIKNFRRPDDVSMEPCCLTSNANSYVYAKDFTSGCNCQTAITTDDDDEEATSGNKPQKIEMLKLDVDLQMIEGDAGHSSTNSESINESCNSEFSHTK